MQFDIDSDSSSIYSPGSPSFDKIRKRRHRSGGGENHRHSTNDSEPPSAANDSPRRRRHHDRHRASQPGTSRSPSPAASDATVDLPERYDRYGRRKPEKGEDPLADTIEDLLSGKGAAGKFLGKLTGAFRGGK